MGVREMLARNTAKRLRWAILRPPANRLESHVKPFLETLPQRVAAGLPSDKFNAEINAASGDRLIFVGCLKPKCKKLFNFDGTPTGGELQSGDILDDLREFQERLRTGIYRKAD